MTFKQDLVNWNGKSADDIAGIYARHCSEELFLPNLLELIEDKPLQKAATWLLKRHFEKGEHLNEAQIAKLYCQLQDLEHWEAKLHILQSIPYMPIPYSMKIQVEVFTRRCLMSSRKLVKAWAYNGFHELANQYSEYQDEATQLFQIALQNEPASVKARVRKILAKGF